MTDLEILMRYNNALLRLIDSWEKIIVFHKTTYYAPMTDLKFLGNTIMFSCASLTAGRK